jgi:hypothetical protein
VDASHVRWRCPKHLQALYKGKEQATTIVVHAVATHNLRCDHLFVGAPGTNNDISTTHQDPLFCDILNGHYGQHTFTIGDNTFAHHYYLADDIYPTWGVLVKPMSQPVSASEKNSQLPMSVKWIAEKVDIYWFISAPI